MKFKEIYLDYAASTPCDPSVVESMMPFLLHEFANPSSPHRAGSRARHAVERARELLGEALDCDAREIVFTAGATESNNLALLGAASANCSPRRRIVTTRIEHKSVLGPCHMLAKAGYEVAYCPVWSDGLIDLSALAELLDDKTFLVSVQAGNNEIGTLQPMFEIAQLAHKAGAILHCDAAQVFGKVDLDVASSFIDLLSISSHKCYGPKGAGALYVRDGSRGSIAPIAAGGGQERGLRPGTQNVAAIVGFGEAGRLANQRMEQDARRTSRLRDHFESIVLERAPGSRVNGAARRRLPGLSSITFPGLDAEQLMANAPHLALSSSSACNAGAPEPSHVLRAIGLDARDAYATIRVGFGRFSTTEEAVGAAECLASVAQAMRSSGSAGDEEARAGSLAGSEPVTRSATVS